MKFSDFEAVRNLVNELDGLRFKRALVDSDMATGLGVTIHGAYQDKNILGEVRPVVVAILDRKIAAVLKELQELGVEQDKPPEVPIVNEGPVAVPVPIEEPYRDLPQCLPEE